MRGRIEAGTRASSEGWSPVDSLGVSVTKLVTTRSLAIRIIAKITTARRADGIGRVIPRRRAVLWEGEAPAEPSSPGSHARREPRPPGEGQASQQRPRIGGIRAAVN